MAVNENDYTGFGPATDGDGARHNINHLPETPDWEPEIYQLETGDYVVGGRNGIANLQPQQLTNRTAWLKKKHEELQEAVAAIQPGTDKYDEIMALIKSLDASTANSRLNHLERLVGNAYLAFKMANIDPDGYDGMVIETFDGAADEIDRAVAVVNSLVSGDDSIDVEDSTNLIIGAHYQLTDGERLEEVQVKSINVSGSIKRVILTDNIRNQYAAGKAKLYRSSVAIYNGRAYGGGTKSTDEWAPNETFLGALTPQPLDTGVNMTSAALTTEGTVVEGGKLILGSPVVGVALVAEGGGNGTWAQVNEEGDALNG